MPDIPGTSGPDFTKGIPSFAPIDTTKAPPNLSPTKASAETDHFVSADIPLTATERRRYQESSQEMIQQAADLRVQLLNSMAAGNTAEAQRIRTALSTLDTRYIQVQQFLGVQNPTGVPPSNP